MFVNTFEMDFSKKNTNEFNSKSISCELPIYTGLKEKAKKELQVFCVTKYQLIHNIDFLTKIVQGEIPSVEVMSNKKAIHAGFSLKNNNLLVFNKLNLDSN